MAKVIIIMGSSSDRECADKIRVRLIEWGIAVEVRVASAHKSARHLLDLLQAYEATGGPRVYVTIAGRSNALGGMVDANVSAPVITCPPYSDRFAGADLYSSLRMPSGVSPMVVLEPENAALAAAKVIGLVDPAVQRMVQNLQHEHESRIVEDDKKLSATGPGVWGSGSDPAQTPSPRPQAPNLDKPRESCGIFGAFVPGADAARTIFFGLYALQHRGQESAGIAVSDGRAVRMYKAMGLVSQVFNEENLRPLQGHIGIGHNRYSTTGSSRLVNAQPFLLESFLGPVAVAHNGNLTNTGLLRRALLQKGVGLTTSCDSEVITQMIAGGSGDSTTDRIRSFMARAEGAYSLAVLTRDALYGVRDPRGFRPLCLGQLQDGWVLASESCALATVGATFVREIAPGEIVRVDASGVESIEGREPEENSLCIFEFIYFARPDSVIQGQLMHSVRYRLGAELAIEHPVEADVVIGVPDSAVPAAIGYAHASGIPYNEGLIKNRYIGRTFIQPDEHLRRAGIALKLNPLPDNLRGKRVVAVDDSIVRGSTTDRVVDLLRSAGAREVHVRISSPPLRHPCFMGVDMATYDELIAHRFSVEEIRQHIHADTLAYLSVEGMGAAAENRTADFPRIGRASQRFCRACFTGSYPVEPESAQEKLAFEMIQ